LSTLSYIILLPYSRDIVLSEEAIQNIVIASESKSTKSILRYTESLRKRRQSEIVRDIQKGALLIGGLSERDILCVGIGLYWGEGYKTGSQEFGFTNSDPAMIIFYIRWLRVVFNIPLEDLILRVSINELHKPRILSIEKFWSSVTDIPLRQFAKASFIKTTSKKIYNNPSIYNGTLRIKVRRGTVKRRIVLGAIEALRAL